MTNLSIPSKEVDDASQLKLFPSQELPRLGSRSIRKASPSNIKYQMNRNKNGPKPAMAGPRSPEAGHTIMPAKAAAKTRAEPTSSYGNNFHP
jgi:hypothetical protein